MRSGGCIYRRNSGYRGTRDLRCRSRWYRGNGHPQRLHDVRVGVGVVIRGWQRDGGAITNSEGTGKVI